MTRRIEEKTVKEKTALLKLSVWFGHPFMWIRTPDEDKYLEGGMLKKDSNLNDEINRNAFSVHHNAVFINYDIFCGVLSIYKCTLRTHSLSWWVLHRLERI